LSHDHASEFITIGEDDDAVVVEEDSDSEAIESLARDDASEFITIGEDDDAVAVEEGSDVGAETETELSASDTIEEQQDQESVNDELNEDDYSKRQYEPAEN